MEECIRPVRKCSVTQQSCQLCCLPVQGQTSLAVLLSSAATSETLRKGSNLCFANRGGSDRVSLCCSFTSPLASHPHNTCSSRGSRLEASISPLLKLINEGLKEEEVVPVSATRSKSQWDQVGLMYGTKALPDPTLNSIQS